jgi:hypothetical protein
MRRRWLCYEVPQEARDRRRKRKEQIDENSRLVGLFVLLAGTHATAADSSAAATATENRAGDRCQHRHRQ